MARVSVSLDLDTARKLALLAEHERRSISGMAATILVDAIKARFVEQDKAVLASLPVIQRAPRSRRVTE